ncbi:unnamed protein product, partial [Staurois parvus]
MRGPGRADIANAGSGRADIANAGSGESGYSECGVRGEQHFKLLSSNLYVTAGLCMVIVARKWIYSI